MEGEMNRHLIRQTIFKLFNCSVVLAISLGAAFSHVPAVSADAGNTLTVCSAGCDYTTIQAAVDAAAAGDTVAVAAGTYAELVVIGKAITLRGEGPDKTILTSPDPLPVDVDQHPAIIFIQHSDEQTAGAGDNTADVTYQVTISGFELIGYPKDGILVSGAGASAKITGNVIFGMGPIDAVPQNGIEVSDGAFAEIRGNTVLNNWFNRWYQADGILGAGILVYSGPQDPKQTTHVLENTFFDNQVGVYTVQASAEIRHNKVYSHRVDGAATVDDSGNELPVPYWGVIALDPGPDLVPVAGINAQGAGPNHRPSPAFGYHEPSITAQSEEEPDVEVTVQGNEVTGSFNTGSDDSIQAQGSGIDSEESLGIGGATGMGESRVSLTVKNNVVSGWTTGIAIDECVLMCPGFTDVKAQQNSITGNTTGFRSLGEYADATWNWWGSQRGPQVSNDDNTNPRGEGNPVFGYVYFAPWLCSDRQAADSDGETTPAEDWDDLGFYPTDLDIGCTNAPTRLVFTSQPSTIFSFKPFDPGVELVAKDDAGNLGINYDRLVSLGIGNNPTGAALVGDTSVWAVNGVARYGDLSLTMGGKQFTLTAQSTSLSGLSQPFEVKSQADLAVTRSIVYSPSRDQATITIRVTNYGPETANDVELVETLGDFINFSVDPGEHWSCAIDGQKVTCALGALGVGEGAQIKLQVMNPVPPQSLSDAVSVGFPGYDPKPENNVPLTDVPNVGRAVVFIPYVQSEPATMFPFSH
jgi:hypothetical protein